MIDTLGAVEQLSGHNRELAFHETFGIKVLAALRKIPGQLLGAPFGWLMFGDPCM